MPDALGWGRTLPPLVFYPAYFTIGRAVLHSLSAAFALPHPDKSCSYHQRGRLQGTVMPGTNKCLWSRPGWVSYEVSQPSIMRRRELASRVINLTNKPRPAFDVYIGRRQWCAKELFEASVWANPFSVKEWGREGAIKRYEEKLPGKPGLLARLPE